MLLRDIYNKLEQLGGFTTNLDDLTEEQEDFLNENNEYGIDLDDLLCIIDDYSYSDFAEICGIYKDEYDLGYNEFTSLYSLEPQLKNYIDFERFGSDLLYDEFYYQLSNGEIVYISL